MRLAVVGDVHDQWSAKDAAALKALDAVSNKISSIVQTIPCISQSCLTYISTPAAAAAAVGLHAVCWGLWQ
jgi:hypothetical protein